MDKSIRCVITFSIVILLSLSAAAQKRVIKPEDLFRFNRIGELALSPNGDKVAYTITRYLSDKLKEETDIYLISSDGGSPRQLTTYSGFDGNPTWSPNGSLLAFLSERAGKRQIFAIPLDGGEAIQICNVEQGVKDFIWSPDGKYFAIVPYDSAYNKKKTVHSYNRMPYKTNRAKNRIVIMSSSGGEPWNSLKSSSEIIPLLTKDFHNYDFSPDGKRLAFIGIVDTVKSPSTCSDVYIALSSGRRVRRITFSPGKKNRPRFSPDGRYLCYMAVPKSKGCGGQNDLMLFDRYSGRTTNITKDFDLDIHEAAWGHSSQKIFFTASDQGRMVVFSVDIKKNKVKGLVHSGYNYCLSVSSNDNNLFMCRSTIKMPDEIFITNENGDKPFELTFTNQVFLDSIKMAKAEDFWFKSFDGKVVHGLLLKPPFINPREKYPLVVMIQEDPHKGWYDRFLYFWNAQLFASMGTAVAMINLRGSKGYGIEFSTSLNGDWTGAAYRDLMYGIDNILKKYSFIDGSKIVAAGGFYGGLLSDWIVLHSDRFSAVISHASVSDLFSYYGADNSHDFLLNEFGFSPYGNTKKFDRISPARSKPETGVPCLLTHGYLDKKVDVTQSMEFFSLLQHYNIESKLLIFDKEGHIFYTPKNVILWWESVHDWIERFTWKD